MSADGDIVREALIPGTSLTVGDQVLAALARLEAAETELEQTRERLHYWDDRRALAEAQLDTLTEALRGLLADDDLPTEWADCTCSMCLRIREARAALADAGLE